MLPYALKIILKNSALFFVWPSRSISVYATAAIFVAALAMGNSSV